MTIYVSKEVEISINAAVRSGRFASADEMVDALVRDDAQRSQQQSDETRATPSAPGTPARRKPLWERAAELRQSIPSEEWDKLPTDGARQLDHYLYGSPKRTDA